MNFKKSLTMALLTIAAATCLAQAQTQTIAHRGFWKTNGAAQNSLASLLKADSIGCYGSEFDVWISKDNKLVVNHDPYYKALPMELSKGDALTSLKLSNGEYLPSLEKYLQAGRGRHIRMILELKAHKNKKRESRAVQEILNMARSFGMERQMEYITFSLHALKAFIAQAPAQTPIYYLNGDLSPQELKDLGATGLDYHLGVFKKHPEWIVQAHALGLKINVWTVDKEEDMRWCITHKADFITTNEPTLLQKVLAEDLRLYHK
ncbi:MAG: glycerophosphodiester phosphodiesterase [Mediterranea sp.]|jgi:glycerophosphoryl diester phosphodiesterase|nr:glycerophosphodiester phosphodiesterase [Mediterranea sp.]